MFFLIQNLPLLGPMPLSDSGSSCSSLPPLLPVEFESGAGGPDLFSGPFFCHANPGFVTKVIWLNYLGMIVCSCPGDLSKSKKS